MDKERWKRQKENTSGSTTSAAGVAGVAGLSHTQNTRLRLEREGEKTNGKIPKSIHLKGGGKPTSHSHEEELRQQRGRSITLQRGRVKTQQLGRFERATRTTEDTATRKI